jgi:hypothetical protein
VSITFPNLKAHYPTLPKSELFKALGGQWPKLVNDPAYANTCAIRLSVALKSAGASIPADLKEAIDGTGSPLVIRVRTMERLVRQLLGQSYWGMSKQPGIPVRPDDIPNKSGIIVYHAKWADATGHFDLWTGSAFVGAGNLSDVADGYDLALWRIS